MSNPSKYAVDVLKGACDRSQNWINVHVEKIANRANKFSTVKTGYTKIRPRIFPKGLSTLRNQNLDDDENNECDTFLKASRNRVHSVDVIDKKVRDELRQQFEKGSYINFETEDLNDLPELDEENQNIKERKAKEALLAKSTIELKVIDVIATPNRLDRVTKWKSKKRQEKVYVKSTDDEDIKIIPSVLLTYQTKFTKITDNDKRRSSLQENYATYSWESIDIGSSDA